MGQLSKIFLICIISLLSINIVLGAKVYGDIYDLYLNRLEDVKITINSEPNQILISKDGTYEFQVEGGDYTIYAEKIENGEVVYSVMENISIKNDEGSYVIDLILFPDFSEDEKIISDVDEINKITSEEEDGASAMDYALGIMFAMLIILLAYAYFPIKDKIIQTDEKEDEKVFLDIDLDRYSKQVLKLIKENDGRTTQKEIRKNVPLSEAKISLIISDLESKKIIKKIKKGRGNIIVLRK